MALFDDQWFTGFQTAATSVAAAVAGILGGWGIARRKVSSDSAAISEDRQRGSLIGTLQTERDDYKTLWREAVKSQLETQETIGRLKGLSEDLQLRANELLEQEMYHQQKIGACDEKVRGLAERVALLNIENREMFAEIARLDPQLAERISQKRWNPPSATAPEQIP